MQIVELIDKYYDEHNITSIRNFVIDGDIISTNVHISMGKTISHGNPADNPVFTSGDLVRVDLVGFKHGLYADAARTFVVDGVFKSLEEEKLLEATYEALRQVQKYVKVGQSISRIGKIIERVASNYGLYVSPLLGGHGIAAKLHSEPFVANTFQTNNDYIISDNTVLCVEPIFSLIKPDKIRSLEDATLIADNRTYNNFVHVENTIHWTLNGAISLTGDL